MTTVTDGVDTSACLCGGTEYRRERGPYPKADGSGQFSVLACRACGLARTCPPPFADDRTATVHQELPYEDVIAREALWRSFFRPILSAAHRHSPGGRFLDVGCGVGLCLQMAEEMGYSAWGVEINERSATFARDRLGRRVVNSDLAAARFPDNFFSVVLLSHVLEHLVRPQAVFDEIRRVLSPEGIVVVEVPNMSGLQVRLLRERWPGWAPEMHVWQFTPRSLRQTLERFGFRVTAVTAAANMHIAQPRNPLKRLVRNTVFRAVEGLASATNHADKVLCIARKAAS